jgi:hypothetical protein
VSDEHEEGPRTEPAQAPGPEAALHLLQERLDRASEAAERLISEAAGRVGAKPPPAGWQRREPAPSGGEAAASRASAGEPGTSPGSQSETEILLALLRSLRDVVPPELQRRLGEAVREVLLALRALIDWYLERAEHRRREPAEVEDIPIS